MASITPTPILMQDVLLKLGADDYAAAVSKAALTPSPVTASWKGLKKTARFNVVGASTWMLDLDFAQDFAAATALSLYTFDNEGTTVAFEVRPNGGTTSGFSGTCIIVAGAIGGEVDGIPVTSTSFPINGKPVRL